MNAKAAGDRLNSKAASATPRAIARAFLFRLLPAALCLGFAGCNVLGILAYKTRGPAPVPAEYVPAKKPTLVMVENYRNPAAVRLDAERMGRYIAAAFDQHQIAPTVDPDALEKVRATKAFATMTQGQVGRAAGASQVVYVNLLKFNVEQALGSEMIRGQVEATVRVVDAETGQTLWPVGEPDGKLLSLETPYLRVGAGTGPAGGGSGATEAALRGTMCRDMADRVAKLFRKWTPDFDNDDKTR